MIDGSSADEAGLILAGVAGLDPRFFSVADLWVAAEAKRRHCREHALQQAILVWTSLSSEEFDGDRFVRFGSIGTVPTIDDILEENPALKAAVIEEERKNAEARKALEARR